MIVSFQAIASFNFLIVAVLIWINRKKLDSAIHVFAFFLFGKGITLLSNLIYDTVTLQENAFIFSLGLLLNSFLYFYAPILYLFARSITKGLGSLKSYIIHFIPFGLSLFLNSLITILLNSDGNEAVLSTVLEFSQGFSNLYYVQLVAYTFSSFWLIKQFQVSNSKYKPIFKWLKLILILFLAVWLVFMSSAITWSILGTNEISYVLKGIGLVLLIALSNCTIVMLFSNPEYFYNNLFVKQSPESNTSITEVNYQDLCKLVSDLKLYQNPDLKIGDLSDKLGLSARNTSQLISTYHHGNFYDFINAYRIEEAKKLLEEADASKTILAVLYESGFNSKSVFNTTFKKIVGETPSAYRVNHSKYSSVS